LWAGIAAFLKVRFQSSELINTIMLNYIAIFLVSYLLHGPLQEPGSPLGQTARLSPSATLPVILPATRLHAGLLLAIVVAVVAYVLLWRTTWGFRIRVVGKNLMAARNAGINVTWCIVSAFLLSGALAGLAGFTEVAGVQRRMIENLSPGYGYTAIVVALLGQLNPIAVLLSAILFAALQVGASTMESAVGVPSSVVTIVQYLIVIFIIGRGAFDLLAGLRRRRHLE
jgi:simple sugar transport system permease protein